MSAPAKKSKSLFQSFSRIHRLSTLGAATVAAWFTANFLQQLSKPEKIQTIESDDSISQMVPAPMMESRESVPSEPTEGLSQMMPPPSGDISSATGEPLSGFAIAFIVALSVVVVGLIIEIIIQSKKEKKKI